MTLLPGETEDFDPLMLGFGNADLTDSLDIVVLARFTPTGTARVIMKNLTNNQVLANVAYRRILAVGTDQYELDLHTISDSSKLTPLDDSLAAATLKWATVGIYLSTVQAFAHEEELRPGVPCQTCINHDLSCTPSFVNRVRVFALCYGTTWVDLRECCKNHDIDYWCASDYWDKLGADNAVMACFFSKIAGQVADRVPWYCGGVITGAIVGAAQATIVAATTRLVLLPVHPGDGRIGGGKDANSCLCGGTVRTVHCETGTVMCEGTPLTFSLEGSAGCLCGGNVNFPYQVNPHVTGATYNWSVSGSGSVVSTTSDGKAVINATGNATVTVTVTTPCGTVTLSKSIVMGKPPKPILSIPYLCPGRDKNVRIQNADCVESWTITATGSASIQSVGSSSFVVRPASVLFGYYCVTVVANRCGLQSDPTTVCGFVLPICFWGMKPVVPDMPSQPDLSDGRQMDAVQVFPNPANDILQIVRPDGVAIRGVQLFDPLGQMVRQLQMQDAQIGVMNVGDLAAGAYMIGIEDMEGKITFRKVDLVR